MNKAFTIEYYPKLKEEQLRKQLDLINARKNLWKSPFFTDTESYLDIENIEQIIDSMNIEKIDNVIILGTGGSIQTFLALEHLSKKKIYPITSSRSMELIECLENTEPDNSIVIPISRGGETLDVNSTIGTFFKKDYNFLGLSSQGKMNQILKKIGSPILDVPDLSGRFAASISNVSIVPAYIAGIEIHEFLKGLEEGYNRFMNYNINLALETASFIISLYHLGYKILFSMPYSKNLEGSVGLFVQEVSESTGKGGKGLMGAYQSAPLSQHSILEFLLGGTKGVVIPSIWTVKNELLDITLNSAIDYINGQKAQSIVNYQADATFEALIEQSVPSMKIELNSPNANEIGELIAFIQSSVYYTCLLLNVNWANNPKVKIGKKLCNDALVHKFSEQKKQENRKNKAERVFKDFF